MISEQVYPICRTHSLLSHYTVIHASSSMKDAINRVGDKYGLPNGWLNTDFMRTGSYSKKVDEVSEYYKTYSNILQIRTVSAEYLIAMKLRSGRKYKNGLTLVPKKIQHDCFRIYCKIKGFGSIMYRVKSF